MKRRGLQLSHRHRWTLYAVSLALFLTGVAWMWVHWLDDSGRAGKLLRDLKPSLMKGHGFAALGFVLLFGTLLPVHVRHSWHAHKNRRNGAFFLTVVTLLTLSGYALYYLGDERGRALTSAFHWWVGMATPALLCWHIRSGRNATRS
jgi:cyanate permease